MNILIVAATKEEINPTIIFLENHGTSIQDCSFQLGNYLINILITGIGGFHTMFKMSEKLHQTKFDLLINAGIAGAFEPNVVLGTVYNVTQDRFGDVGVEHADGNFEDIFEMEFMDSNQYPYKNGWLHTQNQLNLSLPTAKSVTVNMVTGSTISIQKIKDKYQPDIESMEGAAFVYTANMFHTACLQLRAISNIVEPRNKANWNISLAINKLNEVLLSIFTEQN